MESGTEHLHWSSIKNHSSIEFLLEEEISIMAFTQAMHSTIHSTSYR
jgi:hypothetical protein